ncbi:metal ABC transporter permease [Brevibacterium linens]|uniref:Metal ABC transporter permease n=1 Tax=Brevibacterium linens TaxID=1703 RepID=A0A142NQM8_BRELN|nr:methionine ABC transporter permease [Brevibacterium linens]AMT94670.1 metal ABC transporter permease [Brevibacterium linens]
MTEDPKWFDNPAITDQMWPATIETLLMTAWSTALAVLIGLPLGIWLYSTRRSGRNGNLFMRIFYYLLSAIVDVSRSIPYIILVIALIPIARFVVGSALGWQATVVSLTIGAIPFYARLVENALREVSEGKIEAALMMGASSGQVVRQVYIPEAKPGLIGAATVTSVTLVSYTAMAGAVGGGGLGALAISYGYQRYQLDTMLACIIVLVLIVTIIQITGNIWARVVDHR